MRPVMIAALGTAVLAFSLTAQGRPDFEVRRDLAPGARLHLSNIIGDVRIEAAPGRSFEATAIKREGRRGDPDDVEIRVVDLANGLALCVIYPAQRGGWARGGRDGDDDRRARRRAQDPCAHDGSWGHDGDRNDTRVDFTLRVPAGLVLTAGTVSGDVAATGLAGTVSLRSVSGDVRLEGGEGPSIELETVSGDVTLTGIRSREVTGHTVSGEIIYEGTIADGGSYEFTTTSGDISVDLPGRPNATLSAATFSGRFASTFPTSNEEGRRRRTRHSAVWGTGSAKLDMESLSGDISIRSGGR